MLIIKGAEELYRLNRAIKNQGKKGKGLRRQLLKAVRTAAKPALVNTRRAVLAIPITGARGGGRKQREKFAVSTSKAKSEELKLRKAKRNAGLRKTISGAIKLDVKTTAKNPYVRIYVDNNRLPEKQRGLPRNLDKKGGWRHPVFGNRKNWVQQTGKPWFASTIRKQAPKVRKEILKAMKDVARKVEKLDSTAETD